jgi:hypothetical protein
MKMSVQIRSSTAYERNYLAAPWCYLLFWGVPLILIIAGSKAFGSGVIGSTVVGPLWAIAVAWMGAGYFISARACGGAYWRVYGFVMPLLALVAVLNGFSLVTIDWNEYWLAITLIVLASFIPFFTQKYPEPGQAAQAVPACGCCICATQSGGVRS